MSRNERMAVGLAALLLLGTAGARENPASLTPLAQASGQSTPTTQRTRTITFCRDSESLSPYSALNSYSPVSAAFLRQIGKPYMGTDAEAQRYAVTLLEQPRHGQVQLVYEPSHHWTYAPTEGYTGADRATYLVESAGKRYKVVINFWVVEVIQRTSRVQECESIDFGRPSRH